MPGRVDQPRVAHDSFPIPEFLPRSKSPTFTSLDTPCPLLKLLYFIGVGEYLEDVVSEIDIPILNTFRVVFFSQVVFDIPHLSQFIYRAENLKPYRRALCFLAAAPFSSQSSRGQLVSKVSSWE